MDRSRPVAAIVGGGSLLGREIRDLLAGTNLQSKLIGADRTEVGMLTEEGGEAVLMTALDEENLAGARVAFLAGSVESSIRAAEVVERLQTRPALIDLTYALEDQPGAYLRAPMAEPANFSAPEIAQHVVAHPAAILLAVFLARIHQIRPLRRSVAHIFEPASERGQGGVNELEKQTVSLLTFKPLPKAVYDEQVGFNLLARYGSEAPQSLESAELRIERHLATLLSLHGVVPMPSLRLIQAPVFHGYTISLWAEFEERVDPEEFETALASAQIDVRGPDLDPPNIVAVAGQDGISVGAIAADRNDDRAAWFWIAADNIRIMAENALAVARSLAGQPGIARPQ